MSAPRLVGVLLAAGKGSRMGRTKQLIEMPCENGASKSLVAMAFDAIAPACGPMIVVVDTEKERVVESLQPRSFVVAKASGSAQMSQSVYAGLRLAHAQWPGHSVLLQLGDHPAVHQDTVTRLRSESTKLPDRTIIPTYRGTGGHPILIPATMVDRLLSAAPQGSLRDYWRQHPELCVRCEVEDQTITRDLDNPAQVAEEVKRRSMYDPNELMRLAIAKCRDGIAKGNTPFGCAIAHGGELLAVAHNVVWDTTDITAHAEVTALREACREAGNILLEDCIVATTCEPCPMCMSALHWARVGKVYYGATIADADDAGFNELSISAAEIVKLGGSQVQLFPDTMRDECRQLFAEWKAAGGAAY